MGRGEEGEFGSPNQRRRAADLRFCVSPCPATFVAPPICFIRCGHKLHVHNHHAVVQVTLLSATCRDGCAKLVGGNCPISGSTGRFGAAQIRLLSVLKFEKPYLHAS
jgi:hypothetical protein